MSTNLKPRAETVPERVLRQVRTGKLDEDRLLPAADKRTRDVTKRLDKLGNRQGWYVLVAGQAYAMKTGKAPAWRNAEVMLVTEVIRWRRDIEQFAADRLAEFDRGIRPDAIEHPAPVHKARVMRDEVRQVDAGWVGAEVPRVPRPEGAVAVSPEASAPGSRAGTHPNYACVGARAGAEISVEGQSPRVICRPRGREQTTSERCRLTLHAFIATWRAAALKERSACAAQGGLHGTREVPLARRAGSDPAAARRVGAREGDGVPQPSWNARQPLRSARRAAEAAQRRRASVTGRPLPSSGSCPRSPASSRDARPAGIREAEMGRARKRVDREGC